MFDSTAEFKAQVRTAQGLVQVPMRAPKDEEYAKWWKERRVLVRSMGRGRTDREFEDCGASLRLYESIKLEDAPALTQAEAEVAINYVSTCDVRGCDLGTTDADVTLYVHGGTVVHHLRVPTADEVQKWRKAAVRTREVGGNASEVRSSIEAGAALYDKCGGATQDYMGAVPMYHKDQALRAVIDAVDKELGGDEADSF